MSRSCDWCHEHKEETRVQSGGSVICSDCDEKLNPRLDAIEENVGWIRDADLSEETNRMQAARRLGFIKGDATAAIELISKD